MSPRTTLTQLPLLSSLKNWGLAILLLYCTYIGYRMFYGENKLSELSRLQLQHSRLETEYAAYQFERRNLTRKIFMLQENSVNINYLETIARQKLKVAREQETILILPGTNPNNTP